MLLETRRRESPPKPKISAISTPPDKHLLRLVNGCSDLSKIEAGKMTLFVETVDCGVLGEAAEAVPQAAADNGTGWV